MGNIILEFTRKLKLLKVNENNKLDTLQVFSLLYLGIPLFLFFTSWLKLYYAIFFSVCIILPLLIFNYEIKLSRNKYFFKYFIVITIFLVLLGYGEIFPQTHDWDKHNAIFSHLFYNKNKPVYIQYEGIKYFLDYGLGFYIVPSWIASFFNNYYILRWLILINSALGLTLIGLWINRLFSLSVYMVLLVFILGNLGFIDQYLYQYGIGMSGFDAFNSIAQNQFLGNIDRVLQHAMPVFLIFLLLYHNFISKNKNNLYIFYSITIGFFWSPFLFFSIIPILLLSKFSFIKLSIKFIFLAVIPLIIIFIFLVYYYNLHLKVDEITFWIGSKKYLVYRFLNLNLLYTINFLFIYFINKKANFITGFDRNLLILLLVFSELYFHINYGFYHDLWIKSFFLIFLFINILTAKAVQIVWKKISILKKFILILTIVVFSFFPLSLFVYKSSAFFLYEPILKDYNKTLLKTDKEIILEKALYNQSIKEQYPFIIQYLGKPNAISREVMKSDE
ncbi:MAG: hypothetical protein IT243_05820 [Bacteroidia bacterium]|nr:hypothetical protein [Bacteroidia bacterium]